MAETNGNIQKEGGANFDLDTPETLDLQDKDNSLFSIFNAPITNKFPYKNSTLQGVFEAIKGGIYEQQTNRLRSFTEADEAKRFKAYNFEYATFSGTFTERSGNGLISRSQYICIDLDHVGDCNAIRAMKELIINAYAPALMFVSPSGDGLKIVFKLNPKTGKHLEYFGALECFFNVELGQKIDLSGKDISRACFLPHDPDAYYNEGSESLDNSFIDSFPPLTTITTVNANQVQKQALPINLASDEIMDKLITWLNKKESFVNGNRNNFISKLAYAFNRYGIHSNDALSKLLEYVEPGFMEHEIKSIVASVYRHTERHGIASFDTNKPDEYQIDKEFLIIADEPLPAKVVVPTPLLPINGFPFHIQELIKECTRIYGIHQDFWTVSFLQATAIAMGCTYELKDKYTNGAVLWVAIVSPSGIGKSEPFDIALEPIYKAEKAADEVFNAEMDVYNAEIELTPAERQAHGKDVPKKPIQKQYIAIDSTPEGLIAAHQENKRGVAITREEIMGWISDFGRYARSGEVQNMLSSWSEKFFKVIRKNSKSNVIEKPFIPIFGGIQPGKLYALAKDDRALDGFMQRFIFAFPDQCIKPNYNEDYLKDDYRSHYAAYINSLLSLVCVRQPVKLSEEAKQLYKIFFNKNTALINTESSEYTRAVYSKLEIIVLRLALILHVSHHAFDKQIEIPIQPEIMDAAIEMTEYFRITALKVNQYIGQSVANNPVKIDDQGVAQYLMKKGKITKSALATALGTSRSQLDRLIAKPGTPVQPTKPI